MLSSYNKQLPLLLRKLILEMTTMRSIPHPPSAAITVGQMHLGLERLETISRFFSKLYAAMLAAQERAARARLARYQASVYRALQARDHRLALDFYGAKARSEG